MKRRCIAAVLAALLLLSACGSKAPTHWDKPRVPVPAATETPASPGEKTYFTEVWRGDIAYDELTYEHYDLAWFDEYTAPLYRLAEEGGSQEAFDEADDNILDELYYICTLQTLAELRQSAHPEDEEAIEELLYTEDVYYAANDAYWSAMSALARSPYDSLMEERYDEVIRDWFATYEPADDEELERYQEENSLIQDYYRLMAADQVDEKAIGEIFVRLVQLRQEEAEAYGYDSYADYAYENLYSKDYRPGDAQALWDGVREYFVPLAQRHGEAVMDMALLLESGGQVDCSSEAILAAMEKVLPNMSGELYTAFRYMLDYGLYDIAYSPEKVNTGYTVRLYYVNEPFVFNAPYQAFYDYTDTIHEFGHFANAFYTMSELVFGISDNDLSELQSQGLEVLFTHYYDELFGSYADIARNYVLMNMVYAVIEGAMQDEFQQRVYAETDLTVERVNEIYRDLYEAYGYEPYEGCETGWMEISHTFEQPFYYISYGVSALGALKLYERMQEDWDGALDTYLTVCAMDTEEYYYSEALAEAGLADVFSESTYAAVSRALERCFR